MGVCRVDGPATLLVSAHHRNALLIRFHRMKYNTLAACWLIINLRLGSPMKTAEINIEVGNALRQMVSTFLRLGCLPDPDGR